MSEKWRSHRFCISSVVETELWAGVCHSGVKAARILAVRWGVDVASGNSFVVNRVEYRTERSGVILAAKRI